MVIRVLHVVISLETGGLENGIVNLLNHHDNDAFHVDVLCLSALGELSARVVSSTSNVYFQYSTGSVWDSVRIIRRHIEQHQYDIVHSHGFSTMLASYLALWGHRDVVLINGEHGVMYAEKRWQRWLQRFLFNHVKMNFSVSANLSQMLAATFGVSLSRFHTILNGVDTDKFHPDLGARESLRGALGLHDKFVIGSVGRLVAVKDYGTLICAFASLLPSYPHCRLLLVGAGPEERNLKELIKKLGVESEVAFLGRREDVAQLMNAFDLYAQVSLMEGLSNTVLEAMATGLPVVVTPVGGNTEIVSERQNGLFVTPGDENDLRDKLESLLKDDSLLKRMSQQALEFVQAQYGLDSMVVNYENAYRHYLKSK